MVAEYKLRGFMGNLVGAEDSLRARRPVVEISSGFAVPDREDWTAQDLVPIDNQDLRHLSMLSSNFDQKIQESQLIWFIGGELLRATQSSALMSVWDEFASWQVFAGPVRYAIGSLEEFQRLNVRIFTAVKPALHNALFDHWECSHGDAKRIFRVMDALTGLPSTELEPERGIYFHEMRELDSYEYVRGCAVLEGAFESEKAFDDEVSSRIRWFAANRLREGAQAVDQWPGSSTASMSKSASLKRLASGEAKLDYLWWTAVKERQHH